ncbi:MAG: hypothetical protein AAF641_04080 [Pseudomonadota bacterium]
MVDGRWSMVDGRWSMVRLSWPLYMTVIPEFHAGLILSSEVLEMR